MNSHFLVCNKFYKPTDEDNTFCLNMIARVAIANKSMTSTPIINGNLPIDEKLLIRDIQSTNLKVPTLF